MTIIRATTVQTPPGPLTLLADGEALVAGGFTADAEELRVRLDPVRRETRLQRVADLGAITDAVAAYLEGEIGALDAIPVLHAGTRDSAASGKRCGESPGAGRCPTPPCSAGRQCRGGPCRRHGVRPQPRRTGRPLSPRRPQ